MRLSTLLSLAFAASVTATSIGASVAASANVCCVAEQKFTPKVCYFHPNPSHHSPFIYSVPMAFGTSQQWLSYQVLLKLDRFREISGTYSSFSNRQKFIVVAIVINLNIIS